jgi:hypothetical protein
MDDEQLGAVLHRAVSTLEAPTERLVAGGIARGRRRRRIVLGGQLASGAAVVAGVIALIVMLLPGSSGRRTPAAGPSTTPPAAGGTVPVTPQVVVQTALDTLPRPGTTSKYDGRAFDGFAAGSFVYDDGHGAAAIDVSLTYPGASPKASAPIAPCATGSDGCRVLADGTHVLVRQGHQYSDGRQPNPAEWSVDVVRDDGFQVSIHEWNAPAPKGAALTRAEPPFTILQLINWVLESRWQVQVTAERAAAAEHLFTVDAGSAATQKIANEREREAADQVKAAKLAHQRAACAAATAAHTTPPTYCATIK